MILAACLLSLAAGADIRHAEGDPYVEVRCEANRWDVHAGLSGVGAGVHFGKRVTFGLGLEYGPAHERVVDSRLAYELRFEAPLYRDWRVGIKHRSNCKTVCPAVGLDFLALKDRGHNRGFNFLYLRRRF